MCTLIERGLFFVSEIFQECLSGFVAGEYWKILNRRREIFSFGVEGRRSGIMSRRSYVPRVCLKKIEPLPRAA